MIKTVHRRVLTDANGEDKLRRIDFFTSTSRTEVAPVSQMSERV